MATPERSIDLRPDEISIDDEGRVVITNPDLAEQVKREQGKDPADRETWGGNGNCHGCGAK